jgi:hypothetical protein
MSHHWACFFEGVVRLLQNDVPLNCSHFAILSSPKSLPRKD